MEPQGRMPQNRGGTVQPGCGLQCGRQWGMAASFRAWEGPHSTAQSAYEAHLFMLTTLHAVERNIAELVRCLFVYMCFWAVPRTQGAFVCERAHNHGKNIVG